MLPMALCGVVSGLRVVRSKPKEGERKRVAKATFRSLSVVDERYGDDAATEN
jgi:hypothetical protein